MLQLVGLASKIVTSITLIEIAMRLLFLFITASMLTSCASHYSFNSNLDPENFERYYQPSSVNVYSEAQLMQLPHTQLGQVQGESCRDRSDLPPAQASDARTEARREAAKLGANGILFSECITLSGEDALPGCIDNVICIGNALKVEEN
jgi:RcsF protein